MQFLIRVNSKYYQILFTLFIQKQIKQKNKGLSENNNMIILLKLKESIFVFSQHNSQMKISDRKNFTNF